MAEFDRPAAASLLAQQNANIIQLWTVYVVATFAAAGFGFAGSTPPSLAIASIVALAFWFFALGHLSLLLSTLRLARALAADIKASLDSAGGEAPFQASQRALAATAYPSTFSVTCHLVINVVVTAALLSGPVCRDGGLQGLRCKPPEAAPACSAKPPDRTGACN